jgi:hypothetical protein
MDKVRDYEQHVMRLLLREKEGTRQAITKKLEKAGKELRFMGENDRPEAMERGLTMLRTAFFKILDLYYEKMMSGFIMFYPEADLLQKAQSIDHTLKKNTSMYVKMMKDYLRE